MGWSMQGFTSLTIPSGATSGARVIIVNPVTGDVMDVYNALNQLIANIDSDGQYTVYQFDNTTHAAIQHTQFGQEGIFYSSDVDNSDAIMEWASSAAGQPSTQAVWTIQVANNNPGLNFAVYTLQVFAGSDNGTKKPTMVGTERGITGSMVQSDQVSTNNLMHAAAYTGTTDAAGTLSINHNAGFTPTGGVITGNAPGVFANLTGGLNSGGFTSAKFSTSWKVANTGAAYASSLITFYALLWG